MHSVCASEFDILTCCSALVGFCFHLLFEQDLSSSEVSGIDNKLDFDIDFIYLISAVYIIGLLLGQINSNHLYSI